MEPAEIVPGDENAAAVPAAKNLTEPLGDFAVTVRSPLKDVSNLSFADVTLNGSSNQGDKPIVEVNDSSTCGSKSETESPASSTPSRLDTTDDYESADEGPTSPVREVDLSVLASQLGALSLGTPKSVLDRPASGVLFPFSPIDDNSVSLSSPEKDDDGPLDNTLESPITLVGSPNFTVRSPDSDENVSSERNQFLEPVFKVPGAIVKLERPSIASNTTGRGDDTFYTADSTFWSPIHNNSVAITVSPEEFSDQHIVKSTDSVEEDHSSHANASVVGDSASIESKSSNPSEEETLNSCPESDEKSEKVKSPVSDFIANADKITLRKDSPLASSIQDKDYGADLNSSLAPAQFEIDQVISKRHSTGVCKKDICLPGKQLFRRHSFHEAVPELEFGAVVESPDNRRCSACCSVSFENLAGSTNNLNEPSDIPSELEIGKEVVDSCIAAATNNIINQRLSALSSDDDNVQVVNAVGIKENLDTVVNGVCEGDSVAESATALSSNGEILVGEAGVTHSDAESAVQIDNSHDTLEKYLYEENNAFACGREILIEANHGPSPSKTGLSVSGLSIDDSKHDGSLNFEESVSGNESTVIENDFVILSEPNQELVTAHAADCAQENSAANVPNETELPSENTEVGQSSTAIIEDKLTSPKVTHTQKSENRAESTSYLSGIPSELDSDVNVVISSKTSHELLINHAAGDANEDDRTCITDRIVIPSEKTEVTYKSELPSSTTALLQSEQPSENLPSQVEREVRTSDTSGEQKIEAAELLHKASEIAKSAESLQLKSVDIVNELTSPPEETHIVQTADGSSGPTSQFPGIPFQPDSNVSFETSSEPNDKLAIAQAVGCTREDIRLNTQSETETPSEKTEVNYLSEQQSSKTAIVLDEQPSERLSSPVGTEVHFNDTTGVEKIMEAFKLPNLTGDSAEPAVPLPLTAIPIEDKLTSSSEETDIVQNFGSSTQPTSQLPEIPSKPDSNVNVVTSSEFNHELVVAHATDDAKEEDKARILNETKIPTERTVVAYSSELQSITTAFIEAEQPSKNLPSPVGSEARTKDTSGDENMMVCAEPLHQTGAVTELTVSSLSETVAVEKELISSLEETHITQKSEYNTEPKSHLPEIHSELDSNVNAASSVRVDFSRVMSNFGESFVMKKNDQDSLKAYANPCEISKMVKTVDFSTLSETVQEKPRLEHDIASEPIDLYLSPESTTDQNTSDEKGDALSKILATCSKQEQELGGQTFDFSCIQAEAAKVACDISHANEAKSSGQTNKQLMMQSALSAETNNSEAGPVTADEDFNKEEFFHEVTALDFEYLARAGSKQLCPSKLSRQSLFVKFDPLVGKLIASSEDSNSSLVTAMADINQSSGEEGKLDVTPPSHSESDERLIPITPATAKKENRQSAGGHTPSLRQEISKLQELMIQQEQAHQEKADLVEELRSRIAELEASDNHRDSGDLKKKLKHKDEEFKLVQEELTQVKGSNKQLVQVMEEYEKTISQLVTVKEETKAQMEKDKETIAAERDTALQHLSNMEVAFNDIHQKYERAKTVIETLHANEKELKKSYDAVVETVEAQNVAYQKFKQHAGEKLAGANAEIEKIHKEYSGEMARMKAVAKKNELKCKSLEESLEQKKKELHELTQICDELIGKVTGKPYE